jgi:hypothetical protein
MMKKKILFSIHWSGWSIALAGLFLIFSCKKKGSENPYDAIDRTVVNQNPSASDLPEGSFPWLQARIFTPTCANSGCHDGTFEPDFRTMASSYNTLVNHPVIANNPEESFHLRVVPGNAQASWLHERLTVAVPNTSGIMPPLAQQQTPDWTLNKVWECRPRCRN